MGGFAQWFSSPEGQQELRQRESNTQASGHHLQIQAVILWKRYLLDEQVHQKSLNSVCQRPLDADHWI